MEVCLRVLLQCRQFVLTGLLDELSRPALPVPGDVENVHLCLEWFFINALQIALIEVKVCMCVCVRVCMRGSLIPMTTGDFPSVITVGGLSFSG